MTTIAQLKAEAEKHCTLKLHDRVVLAGTNEAGVIVHDSGMGYFDVRIDGTRRKVICRFTGLALIPA